MPETTQVFEHQSVIDTTMQQMIAFHEDPRALFRLTPPPIFMRPVRDAMQSLTSGEREFVLWFGPVPVRWVARHEPGPVETSFADRMLAGPMAAWRHEHIFREVPGGVELTDRVTYAHKPGLAGLLTRLVFDGLPLRFLFTYRHARTRAALSGKR